MTNDVRKDLEELYDVYANENWTATCLMAYRILENALRVHLEYDLKENNVDSIGRALKILADKGYPQKLLDDLEYCRNERNLFMHGEKRANPNGAKNIVGYIMLIVLQIYNIMPE